MINNIGIDVLINSFSYADILIAFHCCSCKEEELVPDPDDARLLTYVERGNIVGGALVDEIILKNKVAK